MVAAKLRGWVAAEVWGASRDYLAQQPELIQKLKGYGSERLPTNEWEIPTVWSRLLLRVLEVGLDEAYGELLAPWFMFHIPRALTTKIAAAGKSSARMFELFSEYSEILPVLHYCKRLKAEKVHVLAQEGAAIGERLLFELPNQPDSEGFREAKENLLTYGEMFTVDHFSMRVSLAMGIQALRSGVTESLAFQQLDPVLGAEAPDAQRLRAIAADCVGLCYKNARSGDRRSNRKKALKWINFALAVLPEVEVGGPDWRAIKSNLANAYRMPGGADPATDAETSLRHLEDVLQSLPKEDASLEWAMLQDNIAAAYAQRLLQDRAENLKLAAGHAARAEEVFANLNLPSERIKAIMNQARSYVEMGPVYFPRTTFKEPEGLGAELGVLDRAEEALRRADDVSEAEGLSYAKAVIYQNLAEVAIQRSEILGQDTLGVATQYLATARAEAGNADDDLRLAHIGYLSALVALRQLKSGIGSKSAVGKLLSDALAQNHRIGELGRAGECQFYKVFTSDAEPLAWRREDWMEAEADLSTAIEMLSVGRNFRPLQPCLTAYFQTLLHCYPDSTPLVIDKYRAGCEKAIEAAGSLPNYRGMFLATLGAGLDAIAERTASTELRMEALDVVQEARFLVSEREESLAWAQIQVLSQKLARQSGGVEEDALEALDADAQRAREILKGATDRSKDPAGRGLMNDFVEELKSAELVTTPQAESRRIALATRIANPVVVPEFRLEFDFRRYETLADTIKQLDQGRLLDG